MRLHLRFAALVGALVAGLAAPALPALAQTSSSSGSEFPDLVPVAIWTAIAAALALLVVSVGYLYRRERGIDTPLKEPPIPLAADVEAHDVTRDAAGNPLPGHALEHAAGLHDDATEQAALLTAREHGGH